MSLPQITGPGLYGGVPEADYHAGVIGDGIKTWSRSDLKAWRAAPTPAHWLHASQQPATPIPTQTSKVLDLGTVVHKLVLGVGQPVARIRDDSWNSPKTRAVAHDARAKGMTPLLAPDYDRAQAMAASVLRNRDAAELLAAGQGEVSGFWRDPESGLWLRIRIDWLTDRELADYKTADSVDEAEFAKVSYRLGYYLQHPMYCDVASALGHPARRFRFIVTEKVEPYQTVVWELDADSIELGRQHYRQALGELADCLADDNFPGYPSETRALRLPYWAFPRGFSADTPMAGWEADDTDTVPGSTAALDYLAELAQLEG